MAVVHPLANVRYAGEAAKVSISRKGRACGSPGCTEPGTSGSGTSRCRPGPGAIYADDEALVRVTAVGICGSDLHWWTEGAIGDAKLSRPLVLGHEGAGVIAAGPRRGERVAIDPAIPCEACRACHDGYRNLCYNIRFAGHGETDGMLREQLRWPARPPYPLPDQVSDDAGALLEPLGVALHAMDLGHVPFGGRVTVVGCGPIGLLLLQVLRVAGAGPSRRSSRCRTAARRPPATGRTKWRSRTPT